MLVAEPNRNETTINPKNTRFIVADTVEVKAMKGTPADNAMVNMMYFISQRMIPCCTKMR